VPVRKSALNDLILDFTKEETGIWVKMFKSFWKIPIHYLVPGTAAGGLFVASVGYYLRVVRGNSYNQYPIYRQAIRLSKKHKGVQAILGMPVVDQRINLNAPTDNFTEGSNTYMRIPLHGPKGSGFMYSHFECTEPSECRVSRLELEVTKSTALDEEQYRDRRLLIYDFDKHGPILPSRPTS